MHLVSQGLPVVTRTWLPTRAPLVFWAPLVCKKQAVGERMAGDTCCQVVVRTASSVAWMKGSFPSPSPKPFLHHR